MTETLTLQQALADGRLSDFIAQEEARGAGPDAECRALSIGPLSNRAACDEAYAKLRAGVEAVEGVKVVHFGARCTASWAGQVRKIPAQIPHPPDFTP